MNRMIFVARPRDYRVAGGSEPRIYRPYVKGRRPVQWVVDCYNARGAWEWTHYGEEVMAKPQAKRMAKKLTEELEMLFKNSAKPKGRGDTGLHQ